MDKVGSITELYRGDLPRSKIPAETGKYTSQLEPPVFDELQTHRILAKAMLGFAQAEQGIRLMALDCNIPASQIFQLSDPKFGSVFDDIPQRGAFMVGWGIPFIKKERGRSIAAEYVLGITDKNILGTAVVNTSADPDETARRRYNALNHDERPLHLVHQSTFRTHNLAPILLGNTINPDQENLDKFREAVGELIASDTDIVKKYQTGHSLTMPEQLGKIEA